MSAVVSERALVARINRKLKPEGEQLRLSRVRKYSGGDYWVHDFRRNLALERNVSLYDLGRALGVLGDEDVIAEDIIDDVREAS